MYPQYILFNRLVFQLFHKRSSMYLGSQIVALRFAVMSPVIIIFFYIFLIFQNLRFTNNQFHRHTSCCLREVSKKKGWWNYGYI
jgi:ABC-type nickel/cobalt efflux system permease component RcnA